jgi:uncharacterized membrane protein YdbT with pleckstrin-like domain
MADIVIRPSLKFIKAGYVCALAVICGAVFVHFACIRPQYPDQFPFLPVASLLILLWPIKRHLVRRGARLTISGDKLRYETGILSKSVKLIQLSKIQDVRVTQSVWQRMFDVGNVSIETAGEHSWMVDYTLDSPRQFAEQITDASSRSSAGLH